MKNDRLLKVFGQIDDSYITEAAPRTYLKEKNEAMRKITKIFRKSAAVAAVVTLCVCILGTTALGTTGTLRGFFKDVFRWDGAVVGTAYDQATDEIRLTVIEADDGLRVEMAMVYPDKVPYSKIETMGIASYQILDSRNRTMAEGSTPMTAVVGGKAYVHISLAEIPQGSYRLVISRLEGGKQAEQPLILYGAWEVPFTK